MDYKASRLMSAATMGYGIFAAVKPEHLARGMDATGERADTYEKVAYGYAARDIPMSLAGMFGPRKAVEGAMRARIVGDLLDAVALGSAAPDAGVRRKVIAVTVGWAALNALALRYDRRQHTD